MKALLLEGTAQEIAEYLRMGNGIETTQSTADLFNALARKEDVHSYEFTASDTCTRIDTGGPAKILVYKA